MRNENQHKRKTETLLMKLTFMLDGLALARRGPFSDGPTHENNEFLNAGPLEKPEIAEIRRGGQNDGIGALRGVFDHHQRRDFHHLLFSTPFINVRLLLGKAKLTNLWRIAAGCFYCIRIAEFAL